MMGASPSADLSPANPGLALHRLLGAIYLHGNTRRPTIFERECWSVLDALAPALAETLRDASGGSRYESLLHDAYQETGLACGALTQADYDDAMAFRAAERTDEPVITPTILQRLTDCRARG